MADATTAWGPLSSGWHEVRLGDVLRSRQERASPSDRLLSVTAKRGVVPHDSTGRRDTSNKDKSNYRVVEPGDVVYNTMRMWQGVSALSPLRGIVSPAYTVCTPVEEVSGAYLAYLLRTPQLIQVFRERSQGLVSDTWNLRYGEFAKVSVRLPLRPYQAQVVSILHDLDVAVDLSEKVIAKKSVLQAALTEDIVRNQSAAPLRRLGDLLISPPKNGYSPQPADTWQGRYMLGLGCLTKNGFAPRQLKFAPRGDKRLGSALLADGDFLMSRSNTPDLVGLAGVFHDVGAPCFYPDLMMKLAPSREVLAAYLEIALNSQSVRRQVMSLASGTSGTMVKIGQRGVESLMVPIPRPEEQAQIIALVQASRSEIQVESARLEKLVQVRSGVANDLLYGHVDVSKELAA